jgi:redox-sensing transcriptional repressor
MVAKVPVPAISRLCKVHRLCEEREQQGAERIASSKIGERLGATAFTVRKDISFLGELGRSGTAYDVQRLKSHVARGLGLDRPYRACVVGLGRLGTALLEYERFAEAQCHIVAGFDSSINRLETIRTSVKVHPAYEIAEVAKREGIELGIIAVPASAAQSVTDALVQGGVRAILNFAPTLVRPAAGDVILRNVDLMNELRILSALVYLGGRHDGGRRRGDPQDHTARKGRE